MSTFRKVQESTKLITAVKNPSVDTVRADLSSENRPVVAVETIGINEEFVDLLFGAVMQPDAVEEPSVRGMH